MEVKREPHMEAFFAVFPFLSPSSFLTKDMLGIFMLISILWLSLGGPAWVLSVLSGFVYGIIGGTLIQLVAMLCSETAVYCFAKLFSKRAENFFAKPLIHQIRSSLLGGKIGFLSLFLLKLNPVVPFIPVTALASLLHFPLRRLLGASLLAGIPLTFLWCLQGSTIADFSSLVHATRDNLLSEKSTIFFALLPVVATAALIVLTVHALKNVNSSCKKKTSSLSKECNIDKKIKT